MTKRKSTKSTGNTAMDHARDWAEMFYLGAPTLEAGKMVKRFPDPDNPSEFRTMTVSEDIFGVFDLAIFSPKRVELLQVTTVTAGSLSAVNTRKTKVQGWLEENYTSRPDWMGRVLVIGWVPRKHFRVWEWVFQTLTPSYWFEGAPVTPPKRARKTSLTPKHSGPSEEAHPFD